MLCQILPNYIVTYNSSKRHEPTDKDRDDYFKQWKVPYPKTPVGSSTRFTTKSQPRRTDFTLSDNAKRLIKKSINQLFILTPTRHVTTKTGKTLYNFQCAFVTFTLPSAQKHPDKKMKEIFSQMLDYLYFLGLRNYVWKAELQKNGNIHFHLCIDQFYDIIGMQKHWNNILTRYGYIEAYQAKFRAMSILDYARYRKKKVEEVVDAYARNRASDWTEPPTVDVKQIRNRKALASYLSKYMAKKSETAAGTEADQERAGTFGRVWARSESLSKIQFTGQSYTDVADQVTGIERSPGSRIIVEPFYNLCFFHLEKLPIPLYNFVLTQNFTRAKQCGYYNSS